MELNALEYEYIVSELQPVKQLFPTVLVLSRLSIDEGMIIFVRDEQFSKADYP